MPFTLPDLRQIPTRPTAPVAILQSYTPIPAHRPSLTASQIAARDKAEQAWHRPLTHSQRRFIGALFANGFDITEAALEADPALNTEAEARKAGKRLMALPSIQTAIEAVHAYYQENTKIRFDDIVAELKAIAFSSIADFWDPERECMSLPPAGDIRYKSLAEIAITPTRYGRAIRIKQYDKLSALEKLLKIHSPTADPTEGGISVNVQTVNIMPVPQGMYLPAPSGGPPPSLVIEHESVLPQARTLPSHDATVLAAE